MKAIVFYYSNSPNTAAAAEEIAAKFQADVFPVEGRRKTIQPQNTAFANYTLYFFGSPAWSGRVPGAIKSFIENLNVAERDIVLFLTAEGNSTTAALDELEKQFKRREANVLAKLTVDCTGLDEPAVREKTRQALLGLRL